MNYNIYLDIKHTIYLIYVRVTHPFRHPDPGNVNSCIVKVESILLSLVSNGISPFVHFAFGQKSLLF